MTRILAQIRQFRCHKDNFDIWVCLQNIVGNSRLLINSFNLTSYFQIAKIRQIATFNYVNSAIPRQFDEFFHKLQFH